MGGYVVDMPGSAGLVLVPGVAHLNEDAAVFEGMLTGWGRQQGSRLLGEKTIADRIRLVRRFTQFAECYPWVWGPGDVEDFTVSLTSGSDRRSPATIRGYHLSLRMFCDYITDARYEWPRQCRDRFGSCPHRCAMSGTLWRTSTSTRAAQPVGR
jgi:integrase/recombinase XerC